MARACGEETQHYLCPPRAYVRQLSPPQKTSGKEKIQRPTEATVAVFLLAVIIKSSSRVLIRSHSWQVDLARHQEAPLVAYHNLLAPSQPLPRNRVVVEVCHLPWRLRSLDPGIRKAPPKRSAFHFHQLLLRSRQAKVVAASSSPSPHSTCRAARVECHQPCLGRSLVLLHWCHFHGALPKMAAAAPCLEELLWVEAIPWKATEVRADQRLSSRMVASVLLIGPRSPLRLARRLRCTGYPSTDRARPPELTLHRVVHASAQWLVLMAAHSCASRC